MSEKIRVIIKRPDEEYGHVTNISKSLKNLQNTVDGMIQMVYITDNICMIVNEEGKLRGMKQNFIISRNGMLIDSIVGTVIVAGTEGEDLCDLDMSFATWKELLKDWGN